MHTKDPTRSMPLQVQSSHKQLIILV